MPGKKPSSGWCLLLIIILICTGIVIWDGADCARRVRPEAIDRAEGKCRSHSVVNIRTSEHHIPSRLSVRMFSSVSGKKRANASSNCAAL